MKKVLGSIELRCRLFFRKINANRRLMSLCIITLFLLCVLIFSVLPITMEYFNRRALQQSLQVALQQYQLNYKEYLQKLYAHQLQDVLGLNFSTDLQAIKPRHDELSLILPVWQRLFDHHVSPLSIKPRPGVTEQGRWKVQVVDYQFKANVGAVPDVFASLVRLPYLALMSRIECNNIGKQQGETVFYHECRFRLTSYSMEV